ncbi:TetR family transcriptional regulator, partial [Mycobacteroides abscessus]
MTEAGAKPRRGRPPASDGDAAATRQRIMEVATDLFAEKGFHATGVAEIGSAAGVRGGALYYHI